MTLKSYIENDYLILDSSDIFEVEDLSELVKYFEGYQKVVFSILINYLKLPQWKTLIFKDLTDLTLNIVQEFVENDRHYFIRTDTYNEYISNVSFTGIGSKVMEFIKDAKQIEKRFVLILEESATGAEYLNIATGRTGIILGQEKQEWVGPGFSEYHLSKDRFPDLSTLHSIVNFKDNSYTIDWTAPEEKLNTDISNLLIGISVRKFGLKQKLFNRDYFKNIVGKDIVGEQSSQDEIWSAFNIWKNRFCKEYGWELSDVDILLKGHAKELLKSQSNQSTLLEFLSTKSDVWNPSDELILRTHEYFNSFKQRLKKLNINPEEKVLTFAVKEINNQKLFTFWDIHNLNLSKNNNGKN